MPTHLSPPKNHRRKTTCLLKGLVDAAVFKSYFFPLLFFKRVLNVHQYEHPASRTEFEGDEAAALFLENHRFQVPADAYWREIRKVSREVDRGLQRAIENLYVKARLHRQMAN
jgi:type I restriction enzyme M protein